MIAPNDPRLLSKIAPYSDDDLKLHDFKDRKELCDAMYDTMKKYGGIGLSANQVGLPYRMFVMGCLSFPFIFVAIKRPKWIEVQYTDEEGEIKKEHMHGMNSRIYQHENEHMNGLIFKDLVSDFKWKRAETQAKKTIDKLLKKQTKH